MKRIKFISLALFQMAFNVLASTPDTQRMLLSGNGPSDAVEWDFEISAGRRTGEKAKIPVPSQWEQHGFGNYDYGSVPSKDKHKEDGLYRREFTVPLAWKGQQVRIVFEGAMTDTSVTVNGQLAGPIHQGGFYQFHYNITDKIKFGEINQLAVLVSKDSANVSVEEAERKADYWVFGGIYRPVWLEARPAQSIEWSAIDAKADGFFRAAVHLHGITSASQLIATVMGAEGQPMAAEWIAHVTSSGKVEISGNVEGIRPWSAEEPNLYQVQFALLDGGVVVHRMTERFGFRTFETRPGQGVFLNGKRIMVKGVNRHCFRAKSGRALDPKDSVADVKFIKSMNMNAVRCAHYPPDKAFLDACDELGLYVENEICTWQKPVLDTPTARRVIGQMIRRDVNHPSILWWANGNEGGWNTEVDSDFAIWDIQNRPVLHPWEDFSGYQTRHYPSWDQLVSSLRGKSLVMPTEYLHGLFDGGHGAGLEDYWDALRASPKGVGGFLWVLADEGIERSDRKGEVDNWNAYAPDGMIGPHHENEASVATIQDIFCPVQIELDEIPRNFNGAIPLRNGYDFRNLSGVKFHWSLYPVKQARSREGMPSEQVGGELSGPSVGPGDFGQLMLPLPSNWRCYHRLELQAYDQNGLKLWTWSWSVPNDPLEVIAANGDDVLPLQAIEQNGQLTVTSASGLELSFDTSSGLLRKAAVNAVVSPLSNGPRMVSRTRDCDSFIEAADVVDFRASGLNSDSVKSKIVDGVVEVSWSQPSREEWVVLDFGAPLVIDTLSLDWKHEKLKNARWTLEVSEDGSLWRQVAKGKSRSDQVGNSFVSFPECKAASARLRCFGGDRLSWTSVVQLKVGRQKSRTEVSHFRVNHRRVEGGKYRIEASSDGPLRSFAWTVHPDGLLDLEYCYCMDQPSEFHGITFDLPEDGILDFSWTGQGPERVWANRMRGTYFGSFVRKFRKLKAGIDYGYPHAAGYYADVREAEIRTTSGNLQMQSRSHNIFMRIGTNDEGDKITTYWPEGNFSVLHAIPGIGNKFHMPDETGPQGKPHPVPEAVRGKLSFRFCK